MPVATNTADGNYQQGQLDQGPRGKRSSFSKAQGGTTEAGIEEQREGDVLPEGQWA